MLSFDENINKVIALFEFSLEKSLDFHNLLNKDYINTQLVIELGGQLIQNKENL